MALNLKNSEFTQTGFREGFRDIGDTCPYMTKSRRLSPRSIRHFRMSDETRNGGILHGGE
jgi:hypothetical protein